ncbi:Spc98 family-domain-containing protein [Chytriomyces sp. MP71]|nr:Spc98 family-domain-containing protein [Chytriomyces sp. MP71]
MLGPPRAAAPQAPAATPAGPVDSLLQRTSSAFFASVSSSLLVPGPGVRAGVAAGGDGDGTRASKPVPIHNNSSTSMATTSAPPTTSTPVTRTLRRLVAAFASSRAAPTSTSSASDDLTARIDASTAFSLRILASRITPATAADEAHAVDAIKKKLTRRDPSLAAALNFTNLCFKLNNASILNRKWAVLHFLLTVSHQTDLLDLRENPIDTAFSVHGIKSIRVAPEFPTLPQAFPLANATTSSARPPTTPFQPDTPRGPCNGYYLHTATSTTTTPPTPTNDWIRVTEPQLLRDMMYLFQGIDGAYVKWDARQDTYALDARVWVPAPVLDLVARLAEVGWLYRHVRAVVVGWGSGGGTGVEALGSTGARPTDVGEGLVRQGFCSGIQKELVKHYELIAQLENQFTKGATEAMQGGGDDFASKGLSLKRLLVWISEPLENLRLISCLVDSSAGLRGGALLSMIHGYKSHGDPFVQEFVETLLKEISAPFFQMLKRWLYEGELHDPFLEFFVVFDKSVSDDNLWRNQYILKNDMIPSFLSRSVAKKCFLIGKSLNFIRYCCLEETFVIERSRELASLPSGFLEYGNTAALEKSVTAAYTSISAHILSLLFGKYKLLSHLQALKKYLLLGQGDFVQNLMDKLGADLSKPAQTIMRHNLTGILESSIRASNAQHDDSDVLRRLDVRLLEVSPGDSGWDVFTLDYHTDSPINTVFPAQSMHQYMKLFTFLWRLKRVEHSLSVSWRKGMTEYSVYRGMNGLKQHFHLCSLVLSEMIHFVFQLQYYILFEVLECSWNELNAYVTKRTGDLDQLIGAHNKYLNNITSRGLLAATTGTNQNMFSMLISLFDIILRFQGAMEELVVLGEEIRKDSRLKEAKEYETQMMKRISSIHDARLDFSEKPKESVHVRVDQVGVGLKEIADEYHVSRT